MKSIAIIYGSSTENTKRAAEKIAERLSEYSPALIDIYDGDEEAFHLINANLFQLLEEKNSELEIWLNCETVSNDEKDVLEKLANNLQINI